MAVEYELKYRATEEVLDRIQADFPGDYTVTEMTTTYYDTPGGDLAKLFWTLRHRREGDRHICTLKTPAGIDGRSEYEWNCEDIHEAIPHLSRLTGSNALNQLGGGGIACENKDTDVIPGRVPILGDFAGKVVPVTDTAEGIVSLNFLHHGVVVDSDPLTQCFMNGPAQSMIQVGFAAKDQGKTVYGIIPVIHQHLDVVQNAGGEILRFVNRQEEWLTLLFIEIPDLLLDRLEHSWFPTFVTDAEGGTELAVKFHDTDGG